MREQDLIDYEARYGELPEEIHEIRAEQAAHDAARCGRLIERFINRPVKDLLESANRYHEALEILRRLTASDEACDLPECDPCHRNRDCAWKDAQAFLFREEQQFTEAEDPAP